MVVVVGGADVSAAVDVVERVGGAAGGTREGEGGEVGEAGAGVVEEGVSYTFGSPVLLSLLWLVLEARDP